MSVWAALGFMALGVMISEAYNLYAWHKYEQGRQEVLESKRSTARSTNNQYR